jgi:thioredoxin reductase
MNEYDIVIIGGGAAGMSAALVLSRARRTVLVADSGSPRNAPAAHMQGFLSRDGLAPTALLAAGRDEVTGYGGQFVSGTVTGVAASPGPRFEVELAAGGPGICTAAAGRYRAARRDPRHPGAARAVGP